MRPDRNLSLLNDVSATARSVLLGRACAIAALVVCASTVSLARAQQGAPPAAPGLPAEPPPTPEASAATAELARDHFRRGEAAYQKGNYPLAIQEWQTAYNADPRPRIQYNIYQAHERLGQLGEAAEALQKYLSSADPDDPYYADATARMAALQQRLQATGIRLVGGVEGASINVSGHNWGRLPRPDRIPVQPGNHRVVVQMAGYRDFTSNVIVPPGQVVDVPIQLERLADPTTVATQAPSSRATIDGGPNMVPFYVLGGVLTAGAIGSAVWMINRNGELDGCDDPAFFCPEQDAVETQRTIALASTITLGVGAIGVFIYAALAGGDSERASASVGCYPTVTGAACRF